MVDAVLDLLAAGFHPTVRTADLERKLEEIIDKGVTMTCIVILEVTAKKGTGLQLLETFRALLPDTRNKDGCQSVEVTTNLDNSDNLVLVERWTTRQHYENYLAWRQQRGDLDKLAGALAGPPSIRYFDLTDA